MVWVRASIEDPQLNSRLGWLFTATVVIVALANYATGQVLRGSATALVAGLVAFRPLAIDDRTAIVPWPVVATAAVALVVRSGGVRREITGYVVVAAVALVVVAELDALTSVSMTRRFAVGMAVVTTMAVQSLWTIAQYVTDISLGTTFLHGQRELQWDLVHVTLVGLVVGVAGGLLFGRFGSADQPAEAGEKGENE